MEALISIVVLAFFAYGAYHVWYVPRETDKKGGSKPGDHVHSDKR